MPVAQLDDSTLNSQGLGKPKPRSKAPREPEEGKEVVVPAPVTEDEPIRMPDPNPDGEVSSEHQTQPEQQEEEMDIKDIYRKILLPEYREITKRILSETPEGQELLAEIQPAVETNTQLSAWENECISQLRSSLSQYQGIEELEVVIHMQVNLPIQPFSFIVKR